MKTDSRIIISIDKQFYSEGDEIRIHIWFNYDFFSPAKLTVLSPAGRKIDSSGLKTNAQTTETFAFTCGGPSCLKMAIIQSRLNVRMQCLK